MSKAPSELTPQTLVKRVMSGTKEYRTKEYLETFAKLSSTELHHSDYSRLEIIKLWNSLQNTPGKIRYFTFSLVDNNHSVQRRIEERFSSAKYAWICHDQDKSVEHKHFHYVLMFEQPRSFNSIANDLEIPVTMLQKVYSKKGILDYLTHENDPNKHHYSLSDITANFDIEEEKNDGDGGKKPDFKTFYYKYESYRLGKLSKEDFLEFVNLYCATLPFSQYMQFSERIFNAGCTGASLSTRAQCPVPHPRIKNPLQPVFRDIFPEQIEWIDKGFPVSFVSEPAKAMHSKDYRKPNPRADLS